MPCLAVAAVGTHPLIPCFLLAVCAMRCCARAFHTGFVVIVFRLAIS